MEFTESGTLVTYYVRVLRVAYTKPLSNRYSISEKPSPIRELTCRTFVPVQLTLDLHHYEDLAITRERISKWVKVTGMVFSFNFVSIFSHAKFYVMNK